MSEPFSAVNRERNREIMMPLVSLVACKPRSSADYESDLAHRRNMQSRQLTGNSSLATRQFCVRKRLVILRNFSVPCWNLLAGQGHGSGSQCERGTQFLLSWRSFVNERQQVVPDDQCLAS